MKYFVQSSKNHKYAVVDVEIVVKEGFYKLSYYIVGNGAPKETLICRGDYEYLSPPEKVTIYDILNAIKSTFYRDVNVYLFI